MFLSALTLILQEILEGAIIIAALLALTPQQRALKVCISLGAMLGMLLSYFLATHIAWISEQLDYRGQEACYASLQLGISLLMMGIAALLARPYGQQQTIGLSLLSTLAVLLATAAEGSEIAIYLQGAVSAPEQASAALAGAAIGSGIGISIGILLYYLISGLRHNRAASSMSWLLALIAANMSAQAILLLTQADWIEPTQPLWDSSALISEYSLTGRLLYALIGYEATPTAAQLLGYLSTALLVLLAAYHPHLLFWRRNLKR